MVSANIGRYQVCRNCKLQTCTDISKFCDVQSTFLTKYNLWYSDEVMVTGSLFAKWRTPATDARCDLELMFLANHIR